MDRLLAAAGIMLACFYSPAQAQSSHCIMQKTSSETVQYFIDENGAPASRLVATSDPKSGDELVYTILIRNNCAQPAADVVIDRQLPPHVIYTKTTAKGDGTDREFSVDGTNYARWDSISIKKPDGSSRPAEPQDIRSIRWMFKAPIAANGSSLLHFHAVEH